MHPVPAVVPEEVHPPSPTATTRRRTGASAGRAGRRAPGAQRQALPQGELPSQVLPASTWSGSRPPPPAGP